MAPRKNQKPRRNGNNRRRKANGNGNARVNVTKRQNTNFGSNGLSNSGALRRPMITRKFIESGSDFLGPLTVKAERPAASDSILLSNSISPSAFPGTRLTQLSNLWERYRFRKFRLRWVPAVPKTIACQLVIYQDTDPLDDPSVISDVDALIRQATAQAGSQQFNFINAMSIDLAQRCDDQLYYTGEFKQNERFSRQGNFYVIQVTDPLNFNGVNLPDDIMAGSLYVDWTCEFQVAQINPSAALQALNLPPQSGSIVVAPAATPLPAGVSVPLGTLTVLSPTYVQSGGLGFTDGSGSGLTNFRLYCGTAVVGSLTLNLPGFRSFTDSAPTLLVPGAYPVTCQADAISDTFDPTTLLWVAQGTPPTFV